MKPRTLSLLAAALILPNARATMLGKPVADVTSASGVNIHFTDPKPGEMEMMQAAGFKWARMDFSWQGTEQQKGVYDFSAYERLLTALEQHGMRGYFIFDYSNPLYEPAGSVRSEEGRQAFARWTVAAVEHFKGKEIIWEFWNEPNGGFWAPAANASEYVAMAKVATDAIRKDHPEVYLTGPATSGVDMAFLKACFAAGLHKQWNSISVHPYRQSGPESAADDYEAMQKAAGGPLTILSGEWGYSSAWSNYDPVRQGRMLAREWLVNASRGVPVSIWYDWHDDGTDPKEPEHHFGTVENAYHEGRDPVYDPKPAYLAAKTFDSVLAKCRFVKRLSLGNADDQALLFEGEGGRQVLAIWSSVPRDGEISLPSDDGEFAVVSHLGESLPKAKSAGGHLALKLEGSPRYLILEHGNAKLAMAPKALPVRLSVAPARNGGAMVSLESLSTETCHGHLIVTGLDAKDMISVVMVQPGVQNIFCRGKDPQAFQAGARLEVDGVIMAEARPRKISGIDATLLANARTQGDGAPDAPGTFSMVKKPEPENCPVDAKDVLGMNYEFGTGWKFVCVYPGKEAEGREIPGGVPAAFGAWIEGDGSGLVARLRLKDSAGRTWQPTFPPIDWAGWRYVEALLDEDTGHWGGDASTAHPEPVAPLHWEAPLLFDNASRTPKKGRIYFTPPAAILP